MEQNELWSHLGGYDIVLASQSPRRMELLRGLGLEFRQEVLPNIDESYPEGLSPVEVVRYISRQKSVAYQAVIHPQRITITADTIVVIGEEILGKPQDREDAKRMLRLLSGATHTVITAVTIVQGDKVIAFEDSAEVSWLELTDAEIDYYLDTCSPYDKAGAYGIQEWVGYRAIKGISGSFYTVMGLPTARLAQILMNLEPYDQ